jgi:hypothetical protein
LTTSRRNDSPNFTFLDSFLRRLERARFHWIGDGALSFDDVEIIAPLNATFTMLQEVR